MGALGRQVVVPHIYEMELIEEVSEGCIMYNILIADDESYQRLGMKKLIEGLRPDYRIATAKDGQEALNILVNQEIDIAFIDIIMPHITGINLIEQCKKLNISTRLIIVSAHKDFAYAQKALQLGVFDYILKPILLNTISDLLLKVENVLFDELSKVSERKYLENQLSFTLPVYQGHLLSNWIMDIGKMPEYVPERLLGKRLGLIILVDVVEVNMYEPFKPKDLDAIQRLVTFLGDRFQNRDRKTIAFKIESEATRIAILVASDHPTEIETGLLAAIASDMVRDAKANFKCLCALGIGGVVDNVYENVKYSYRQGETALKYLFYTGYPAVLCHNDILYKNVSELDSAHKNQLILAVREYDVENVCKTIDNLYLLSTTGGYIRPQQFIYTLNMWILDILELYRHAIRDECFNKMHNQMNNRFFEEKTFVEYSEQIIGILSELVVTLRGNLENKHDDTMKECIAFLQSNFHMDLSLQEVVARCYMSTSYFSAIFKMHTGKTLNQYLLDLRMNHAKTLLGNPEMKIYEITNLIGYQDTKYFHRIFKKYFKMTPQEYKNKVRKTGETTI